MNSPNILYILSDQHCGYATGFAGDPNLRTPHLDALAQGGAWFERAYANCPICTPSRGTIFSGRHAHCGPVQSFTDAYKATGPSTATILKQHGYRTAYFGKWHLGVVHDQIPPDVRAHPEQFAGLSHRTPEHLRAGFGDWFGFEIHNAPFDGYYYRNHETNPRRLRGYQTDALTDLLTEYVQEYSDDAPLFAVLLVEPPHFPLEVEAQWNRFDKDQLEVRGNFTDPALRKSLALITR